MEEVCVKSGGEDRQMDLMKLRVTVTVGYVCRRADHQGGVRSLLLSLRELRVVLSTS